MCLEPVAKCGAEHARRSARRSALHDKVFAVEKICRVAWIERKRLETGKRSEHARRPLPSVSHQVVNSERAGAFGKRIDGRRIPVAEIKVAQIPVGFRIP